jgi:hypothetical protein
MFQFGFNLEMIFIFFFFFVKVKKEEEMCTIIVKIFSTSYNCYVGNITLLNKTNFYIGIITEATQIIL